MATVLLVLYEEAIVLSFEDSFLPGLPRQASVGRRTISSNCWLTGFIVAAVLAIGIIAGSFRTLAVPWLSRRQNEAKMKEMSKT